MMARLLAWFVLLAVMSPARPLLRELGDVVDQLGDDLGLNMPASVVLKDGDTFDYIVVGAGGAGAPAAARLALAGADVLLVEAGGNPNLISKIPGVAMALLGSSLDWQYPTIPNNVSCLSSRGRQCPFSRGKCLGGSTSINYMMYVRGNRRDYDDLGIDGWAWQDLEPYFLRYEGLQDLEKLPLSSVHYHNTTGTMEIGFFTESGNSWHSRIIRSFKSLHFPFNPDVNADSQIGVTQLIGYVHEGERMSTARGYLARDDVKRVLKVAKRTRCTGVMFDDDNEAIGITVVTGLLKRKIRLYVREEVVLSAGTVGTAQILMLSGIGSADHLRSLGIPVRANLPVGDNISDHSMPLILMTVDRGIGLPAPNPFVLGMKGADAVRWLATRDGPLASNGLTDITALLNTRCYDFSQRRLIHNTSDCDLPSLQLIYAYIDRNLLQGIEPLVQQRIGLNSDIVRQISAANVHQAVIVAAPVVLRPYSRGTIRLASANPLDNPAIYSNYLSDDRDLDELVRSITILEHQTETPEFKAQKASLLHLKLPGCGSYDEDREAYWRCYFRHMTYSVFHAVGSARLGAVLDARLRVRGVARLRVADLSALPELPRGNTAAAAIAIGERVADFLLEESAEDEQKFP